MTHPHLGNVSVHHKDQALTILMHYLTMGQRARLAIEAPAAYNAITGSYNANVVHRDGTAWKGEES